MIAEPLRRVQPRTPRNAGTGLSLNGETLNAAGMRPEFSKWSSA
jgi:hypothetical protein